eukprot:GILI01004285.1.p1 GENE.GILI01004285.1~~GILI01004285.1.p1  ORF type:complete len:243 (-),score=66.90 GILI01004285.1:463-1149(-)
MSATNVTLRDRFNSLKAHLSDWKLAYGMTSATAFVRLIPHPSNFTPVGAMGLYSGARLPMKSALLFTFFMMIVTDAILGFMFLNAPWNPEHKYTAWSWTTPAIYLCIFANILLGRYLRLTEHPAFILGCSLVGSLQFWLITNLAVYLVNPLVFPGGLIECYTIALPFLQNAVFGDLIFTSVIFFLHFALSKMSVFRREAVAYLRLHTLPGKEPLLASEYPAAEYKCQV